MTILELSRQQLFRSILHAIQTIKLDRDDRLAPFYVVSQSYSSKQLEHNINIINSLKNTRGGDCSGCVCVHIFLSSSNLCIVYFHCGSSVEKQRPKPRAGLCVPGTRKRARRARAYAILNRPPNFPLAGPSMSFYSGGILLLPLALTPFTMHSSRSTNESAGFFSVWIWQHDVHNFWFYFFL